jgi:hypothetical protein
MIDKTSAAFIAFERMLDELGIAKTKIVVVESGVQYLGYQDDYVAEMFGAFCRGWQEAMKEVGND